MAPTTNTALKESARVIAASAGSAGCRRGQAHRPGNALVDEDAWHHRHGTGERNGRKRQPQAIGRDVGHDPDREARKQRRDADAEVLETQIAKTVANHAAHDRHPQDTPRRVVERTEPAGGHAGERHVQPQGEWRHL